MVTSLNINITNTLSYDDMPKVDDKRNELD